MHAAKHQCGTLVMPLNRTSGGEDSTIVSGDVDSNADFSSLDSKEKLAAALSEAVSNRAAAEAEVVEVRRYVPQQMPRHEPPFNEYSLTVTFPVPRCFLAIIKPFCHCLPTKPLTSGSLAQSRVAFVKMYVSLKVHSRFVFGCGTLR